MPAVVIAATNLMPSLQERLANEGELLAFADTEPIQALQAILEQRPSLIVLERLFAATPRGAALINRIKTDPKLANAEVRVTAVRREGTVRFAVIDTGAGIAPEHVALLFDRYWQADHADQRGAGLGLSIAKAIVTAHRGTIGVMSTVGQGSTFYFDLPIA